MIYMKKHILFVLMILGCLKISAYQGINFNTLDIRTGLSDNYVKCIHKDNYGFMWFGTQNGLNRYDGYHFRKYNTIPLGASNNNIEWISEDGAGTIWVKSRNKVCFYNRENDELDTNLSIPLETLGIKDDIESVFVDEDRNLWCTTDQKLFLYEFSSKNLSTYSYPENKEIYNITCRDSKVYILFSDGEIASIDSKAGVIHHVTNRELLPGFVYNIYIDTNHDLWFYMTHTPFIHIYSESSKCWSSINNDLISSEKNFITSLIEDKQGNVWIGTDNTGVLVYNMNSKNISCIKKADHRLFSLPSNHITAFFRDEKNTMWVGTAKQGIAYANLNNLYFENFLCPIDGDISSINEDEKGNIWFGYDGEGIASINSQTGKYTLFNPSNSSIPTGLTVCTFRDSSNRMWWGTFGKGAFYYKDGKFTILNNIIKSDIYPEYIRRITEDKFGNIWFATFAHGLYCLNKENEISVYNLDNSILNTNYIADLSCVDGNTLYIATSSGVYRMNTNSRQIIRLEKDKLGNNIIQDNSANCLYQDSRGLLWIGGLKGINIYNNDSGIHHHLSLSEGLSNPFIHAIIEDFSKNIWLVTDKGLTHIIVSENSNPGDFEFNCFPYYKEDGVANFNFNSFAVLRNRNNEILIGGSGGYIKIRPDFKDLPSYHGHVTFTNLYLSNQHIGVGTKTQDGRILLRKNIQLLDEITMNHSDSHFALEVSAMDYGNMHKQEYAYRLGEDGEWIRLEGNRIYFNKLAPGKHLLQVKVTEDKESNNHTLSTITINVKPPLWLSVYAYFLYIFLIIVLVAFSIRNMKKKQQRSLNEKRKEIEAAKIHEMNESKMRFFTNVSHDLRTPLSLIITPAEKLSMLELPNEAKIDIDLINRNAQILLNEVNQLLDFRKLDQQKTSYTSSFGNISEFIKDICNSFKPLIIKNKINMNLIINSPVIEMNFDCNKIQRIIFNLLSNAIKYNNENGSVTITIDKILSKNGEQVSIIIADTGIGIKDENKENIFERFYQEQHDETTYIGSGIGLNIVREYVLLHEGTISVCNNIPQGSIFTILLPVKGSTMLISSYSEQNKDDETDDISLKKISDKKLSNPTILVVEDNEEFRQFIITCLKDHYNIYEAPNGKAALKILNRNEIDLVLSDVMMPIMNGYELCNKIKTDIKFSHIPVILLTAKSAEENILDGLMEGADDYITKPFNLKILLLRISTLLKRTEINHEKFRTLDVSPSEITISSLDEQLIERAIKCVEDNMGNPNFSVEELSAGTNMSRGHLYRKMMNITGKSPLEFIRTIQAKRGKQLLEQSQLSISQIAHTIGISPKQFSKSFKEEYGCLPSEYEKNPSEKSQ